MNPKWLHLFDGSGCVYMLTFGSRRRYIGQSGDLRDRMLDHRRHAHDGSKKLRYQEWREHGEPDVNVLISGLSTDRSGPGLKERTDLEDMLIDKLRPELNGDPKERYKKLSIAATESQNRQHVREKKRQASTGRKHTPETRAKISRANIGKKRSPETCAEISNRQKGKKRSPETCAKISQTLTGKKRGPHTPATRAKISEANTGKGRPKRYAPKPHSGQSVLSAPGGLPWRKA